MAGVHHREPDADDRADAGSGRGAHPYRDLAAAFERVADDLSLQSAHPGEPEAVRPSLEEPWDPSAADELARLYVSGDAGLAQPLSADAGLQQRLARIMAQAAVLRPPVRTGGLERGEIEARLADMARGVEASLAKINSAADAGEVKLIGVHISELLAQAQEARIELGRLNTIETQIGELKASLSEGRIAGFIEAVMPTGDELARLADAAAQKALRAGRETPSNLAATARLNERSGDIHRLLSGYIDEHRQSDQQVAEALETMQQAMQHILDRIDAIEGAQAAALEAGSENPHDRQGSGHVARPQAVASAEDARARAGFASGVAARAVDPPGTGSDNGPHSAGMRFEPLAWGNLGFDDHRIEAEAFDAHALAATTRLSAEKSVYEEDIKPFPALGRRASGGHADARPPVRAGMLLAASLAAFLLAGYWLVSGPRLRLPDDAGTQSAGQQHPVETPSAPPALRSFSGGPGADGAGSGRYANGRLGSGAPDQAIEHSASGGLTETPETQAQSGEKGTAGAGGPAGLDRWTGPSGADTLQGPVGVVVDQGRTAMSAEDLLRMRQRQRMATLSTRLSQQAPDDPARPVTISTGEAATGQQDVARTSEAPQPRVSVALPPLMIGPHSLRHAAANGDASAQFEVAARFAEGKGVKQDFEQAATWYQRAATQGLAAAQYRLAALYERGIGVKADVARAKAWYKRAAEQGNLKAMHNLAVLSAGSGESPTPDHATASRWFAEAAAHGLADSQYNLGVLHENGLGVAKNYAAAYKWYALAARSGDKEAMRRRDLVQERLTPAAVKSADAEVATWQALPTDQLANDARAAGEAWKGRAAGSSD